MSKIRTIIIDDEKNALDVLKIQLLEYCDNIELLESCNSGAAAIAAIKKFLPDLIFLDIEMPHKNGFDVLNETKGLNYKVIFTTAYDQFAVKAFKYSALDYLLKPIDIAELQDAVRKVNLSTEHNISEKIETLFKQIHGKSKIAIPVNDSMQLVEADAIIRCESESNYTHIFLNNGRKITTAKTLKEVEEILRGLNFCRVHQSHLVNLDGILKIIKGENMYILLKDDSTIPVSRNKKEEFMDQFRKL